MQANFFDEQSPYLGHPMLTAERSNREVDFVVERLALADGANVLDIGCAFGRHSVALAQRGYDVTGIDPSETMITAAKIAAAEAGVSVDFEVCAGEDFRPKKAYSSAICLFTTFGQISENTDDNRALLAMANKALVADGEMLIEVPNRTPYLAALRPGDRFGSDEHYTDIVREYDEATSSVSEQFTIVNDAETRNFLLRYRLFTQTQMAILLRDYGFSIRNIWQDYDANPIDSGGTMMIFHVAKSLELIQKP